MSSKGKQYKTTNFKYEKESDMSTKLYNTKI